jgi:arylsulfatase A-like enzyme
VFTRAYCQQAVCNPSRVAVMTGRRPENTGVLDLPTFFRDKVPDAVTVAQHFKAHGYYTQSFGKIFHTGHGNKDDAESWSAPSFRPGAARKDDAKAKAAPKPKAKKGGADNSATPPYASPDVADDALADGRIAARAIEVLRDVKDKPFFLAVGFLKPHLPFVAPKRYWDLYDPSAIPLAPNQDPPKGAPAYASNNAGELRGYQGMPKQGPIPEAEQRKLKHGYYACVSYMDAQVGKLLAVLDELKLRDNTVVILWGDHGWQLGEHGTWAKHTAWEDATRSPLVISVPGQKSAGKKSDALVEFVDIFPTLADVCRLPAPAGVEGTSFRPLLDDPGRGWKSAAFSVWPKNIPRQGRGMGRAIRTDRYRLVEWRAEGKEPAAYELYDHRTDPREDENLAGRSEHRAIVEALTKQLNAGWKAARPK